MIRDPRRSDRGLANGILYYIATLVIAILLWVTLNSPFTTLMDYNRANCVTTACATGTSWIQQGWSNAMWLVFLLGLLLMIVWAVFESRRPGP